MMYEEDYLQHYGVLGMKWGIRRAKETRAVRSNKRSYKTNKDYKSDLNKARVKAANRLYSRNSKAMNEKIATQGMGKTLAKSALLGSYGAMKYDKARTEGSGRAKSAVKGYLKNYGNVLTKGIPAWHEYAVNRGSRKGSTSDNFKKVNSGLDKAAQTYTKNIDPITKSIKSSVKSLKKKKK